MVEKKRSRQKDQNKSQIKVQIAKSQICLSLSRGAVAERSKAAGLGPVLSGGVGSNPTGVILFKICFLNQLLLLVLLILQEQKHGMAQPGQMHECTNAGAV